MTTTLFAQEANADKAKSLLKQGTAQFEARDYAQAQASLLKAADLDALTGSDKTALDGLLVQVAPAIRKQRAALEAFRAGEKALKAGSFDEAKKQFAVAASSEFLQPEQIKDAKAELAFVDVKIKAAAAAKPAPVAVKPVEVKPVAVPVAVKPVEVKPVAVPVVAKPVEVTPVTVPVVATPVEVTPVAVPVAAKPVEVAVVATPVEVKPVAVPVEVKPVAVTTVAPAKPNLLANADTRKKALAAEHLAAGKKLLDAGKSKDAVSEFQNAATLDPTLTEAPKLLAYAKKLSMSSGGGGVLNQLIKRQNIRRGEAMMEYEKAMKRSRELMLSAESDADFGAAIESAKSAGNIVETAKSLFDSEKYSQMQAGVTRQIEWVETNRTKWAATKATQEREQIQKAKEELIKQVEAKRLRRISDLRASAMALGAGRDYPAALRELNQILILDPQNRWANEQTVLIKGFVQTDTEASLITNLHEEVGLANLAIMESEIPWHMMVKYPKNWKEITVRRKPFAARSQAETELDRVVRRHLDAMVSKLDFEDMELTQVFQFLRDVSGANIHVKWRALALESIEPATTVNVHLANVSFRKALDTILADVATGGDPGVGATGLGYVIDEGVITISTKADLGKQTVVRVYDIRDMIVRVPMFEGPRLGRSTKGAGDQSSNDSGLFDPGAGGGDTGSGLEDDMKSRSEIITEIKTLITETVARDSWREAGGEAGAISEMNGQLVITQTIENHDNIIELIGKLREARALEVSIEARFITVASGFLNRVGIDLDFYFNLGSKFTPPSTVTTPGGNTMLGAVQNGQGATPLDASLPAFTNTIGAGGTGVSSLLGAAGAAAAPAFSFGGQFLDDVQVSFLLEATQAHDMTRILVAPRITLFNGQRAYISLSTEETYISGTDSQVGSSGGIGSSSGVAQDVETDTVTSGTVLDVEATVSADRRYVTMTIRPQVSTSDLTNQVNINPNATVDPITGVATQAPIMITLPTITTRDLQTTVSVPDGGTLLLGGQKESITVQRELGVPVLSKVPFLRRLFTNTGDTRDESTLMIMVRPSIIIQSEKELEVGN
ncbi:MAG: hypothetical protein HN350_08260 [Phycisphaerales bacterium]|nr:hypothetical protein [Phycisphaerales bacterium]